MVGEGSFNPSHSYRFDASPRSRCPEPGEGSQVSSRTPEGQQKELQPVSEPHWGPNLNAFMQMPQHGE